MTPTPTPTAALSPQPLRQVLLGNLVPGEVLGKLIVLGMVADDVRQPGERLEELPREREREREGGGEGEGEEW